ncbi:hypothetical protein J6590_034788 [Homalodisca vitripennis]|nr:hypothetical protein J6590_034788 [Homalodisca vitripennis]
MVTPYYIHHMHITRLERIQRSFVRLVGTKMGWRYLEVPVDNLMRQLDLCPLVECFDFADLLFLYKLVNGIANCCALLRNFQLRSRSSTPYTGSRGGKRALTLAMSSNCTGQDTEPYNIHPVTLSYLCLSVHSSRLPAYHVCLVLPVLRPIAAGSIRNKGVVGPVGLTSYKLLKYFPFDCTYFAQCRVH